MGKALICQRHQLEEVVDHTGKVLFEQLSRLENGVISSKGG